MRSHLLLLPPRRPPAPVVVSQPGVMGTSACAATRGRPIIPAVRLPQPSRYSRAGVTAELTQPLPHRWSASIATVRAFRRNALRGMDAEDPRGLAFPRAFLTL